MKSFLGGILLGGVVASSLVLFINKPSPSTPQPQSKTERSLRKPKGTSSSSSGRILSARESNSIVLDVLSLDASSLESLFNSQDFSGINKRDERESTLLRSIFSKYASLNPSEGLEKLNELKGNALSIAREALYKEWIRLSPEEALSSALGTDSFREKKTILNTILPALSKTDPERAFALAKEEGAFTFSILQNWANQNPELAYQTALDNGNSSYTSSNILSTWISKDKDSALTFFNNLDNPTKRKEALKGIIQGLATGGEDLLSFVNTLEDEAERTNATGLALREMTKDDPDQVAKLLQEKGQTQIGGFSIKELAREYLNRGEEEADAFIASLEDPKFKTEAVKGYISQLSQENPLKALEYSLSELSPDDAYNNIYGIGSNLGKKDPIKGLDLALQQPDSKSKTRLLTSLYNSWIEKDLDSAIDHLNQVSGKEYNTSFSRAGYRISEQPDQGIAWIDTIQNSENKNQATKSFVQNWAKSSPEEAAEWVNTLPDGLQHDSAVQSLVNNFSTTQPDYALEWAFSTSDPRSRNSLMRSTYTRWKSSSPQEAEAWLQSTDLISNEQRSSW